jgi:hypothetical protein
MPTQVVATNANAAYVNMTRNLWAAMLRTGEANLLVRAHAPLLPTFRPFYPHCHFLSRFPPSFPLTKPRTFIRYLRRTVTHSTSLPRPSGRTTSRGLCTRPCHRPKRNLGYTRPHSRHVGTGVDQISHSAPNAQPIPVEFPFNTAIIAHPLHDS